MHVSFLFFSLSLSLSLHTTTTTTTTNSYKTKILKPMADVTDEDILDNLPPAFEGGRRTMAKVCMYARDVMFAQITQLFGDGSDENDNNEGGSIEDRTAMAKYLKLCLDDYMANNCKPPKFGEAFEGIATSAMVPKEEDGDIDMEIEEDDHHKSAWSNSTSTSATSSSSTNNSSIPATGNVVIRRKAQETPLVAATTTTTTSIRVRQPPKHERAILQALGGTSSSSSTSGGTSSAISNLFQREHAPGIRKPGCPCCNPDDPSVLADSFLLM